MGIQGLLPFLKKIHSPVNLAQFEGCTVAIDAYCWLHKGAFSCAEKLALGEKTDQYVYYCMKYIEFMLKRNIKPIMVFDGCHLPSKKDVEKSRREKRETNRKKAAQLLREGKRSEARECLQRCIDISPEMALNLMNTCRARGVDCIVAPYEADAQLAFLNKAGIAQIIITEDSDLLLFGCEKVIFKMDHMGNGLMIEQKRLNEVLELSNAGYTFDKFRYMCILSGCDYLPSLPGIGLAKACKVFKLARQDDIRVLLKKFPSTYLKMSLMVTEEYVEGFIQANNTFLYQLVFDPLHRELRPLNRYPAEINAQDLTYAGPTIPQSKALQIALGNINIYTGERFADFDPDTYTAPKGSKHNSSCLHLLSMWNKNYRVHSKQGLQEKQNADRPNLQGKVNSISSKNVVWKKKVIEDSAEVLTNNKLTELYEEKSTPVISEGASDDKKASPSQSPKRRRRESSESDEGPLSPVRKFRKLSQSPQKFFQSLVEAGKESPERVYDTKEDVKESEKENGSPKRNKFAVASSGNKSRFNINANRVVKSRFFASASPEKSDSVKEDKFNIPMETEPQCDVKPLSPKKENIAVDNESSDVVVIKTLRESKESPGSTFSWSKFKFLKTSDNSDSPKCSSGAVKSQFKRVVSDSNLKKYFVKTEKKEEENLDLEVKVSVECETVDISEETEVSYSQQSNTYSIDSFCMGGSQTLSEGGSSQNSISLDGVESSGSSQNLNRLSGAKDRELPDVGVNSRKVSNMIEGRPSTGTPMPTFKKDSMKGCRVSGLSKGRKSKTTNNTPATQQNIKNFLSKFAHTKTQSKYCVKEEEDVETVTMTPTSSDFKQKLNGVQRKLIPS